MEPDMSKLTKEITVGPVHLPETSTAMDELLWLYRKAGTLAGRVEAVEDVLNEAIAPWEGHIGTHSFTCYQYHASCLAHMVKRMLEADE